MIPRLGLCVWYALHLARCPEHRERTQRANPRNQTPSDNVWQVLSSNKMDAPGPAVGDTVVQAVRGPGACSAQLRGHSSNRTEVLQEHPK